MRRSTRSVLLSAFVFPGAGHFFLGRYRRGAALMAVSLAGLAVIVYDTVQQVGVVVEKLQSGQGALDANTISRLLAQPAAGSDALAVNAATYGIALCWILAIVDSYRIGNRQDAMAARDSQEERRVSP